MTAFDTAVQSQIAEALVSINMIRNENPPIFVNEPYTTTVPESISLGSSIYKISATDADNVSTEYWTFIEEMFNIYESAISLDLWFCSSFCF